MILSEVRELLYDVVVPNIDNEANVLLFNKYLNFACERLINSGKWKNTTKEVAIDATDNFITLPPRLASCLAVRFSKDNIGNNIDIRNQWFRYLPGGSYLWNSTKWSDVGYSTNISDLGDGFVTFADSPYTSYTLKTTLENAGDIGLQSLVKGVNTNKDIVFTDIGASSFEGEVITNAALTATSVNQYSGQIYAFQKQPSQGYVKLEAIDVATGASTTIGRYSPSETIANYRRYNTAGAKKEITTANAICKLRFLPVSADVDEVFPSNLGALRNALIALKLETEGDSKAYMSFMVEAFSLLNNEMRESRGGARFELRIDPNAFSFDRLYQGR